MSWPLKLALRARLTAGSQRESHVDTIGRAARSTVVKHLPHETEEAYIREKSCYCLDDFHTGLRDFN